MSMRPFYIIGLLLLLGAVGMFALQKFGPAFLEWMGPWFPSAK